MNYDNETYINTLRGYIDDIDESIVNMLNSRFDICLEIGKAKKNLGLENVYVPEREKAIIDNLSIREHHKDMVQTIWPVIMEYSRSLQKQI